MSIPNLDIQSSVLLAVLPTIPGNTGGYICAAIVCVSFTYRAVHCRLSPDVKLKALEDAIGSTKELLAQAKLTCAHNCVKLLKNTEHLLKAEIELFQINDEITELNYVKWKGYFGRLQGVYKKLDQCTREVDSVQDSIKRTIEEETQRKLSQELHQIEHLLAVMRAPILITPRR